MTMLSLSAIRGRETMEIDIAFNLGSDARIAGRPYAANPYIDAKGNLVCQTLFNYWLKGWDHADEFWGVESGGRARPLPPVEDAA